LPLGWLTAPGLSPLNYNATCGGVFRPNSAIKKLRLFGRFASSGFPQGEARMLL